MCPAGDRLSECRTRPNLAEASSSLAQTRNNAAYEPNWAGAEIEVRIALSLNPAYPRTRELHADTFDEEPSPAEALQ